MKKLFLLLVAGFIVSTVFAQTDTIAFYKKSESMVPMRDGIKLHTVIFSPVGAKDALPVLIQRTPYGTPANMANDSAISFTFFGPNYGIMMREGYYLVIQDIRGKYKSEGAMQIHQPLIHVTQKNAVDESTDTWDTVDWLVKNLPNNNGKAGIVGVSYPGWLALVGAVDPHPALKASSVQACMSDLFLGY